MTNMAAMETPGLAAANVLNSVDQAVLVAGDGDCIKFVNHAAELFFGGSAAVLIGRPLSAFIPEDSPLFLALEHVRRTGASVSDPEVVFTSPRIARESGGEKRASLRASPMAGSPDDVVVTLVGQSFAQTIDRQLMHRKSARSIAAMAAMLAHEVKNPLSGIRGAAQLLGGKVGDQDRPLADLICGETDRIVAMIDRMESFGDAGLAPREAVNIHQVLGHVQQLATQGFAAGVRFREEYDPSLPAVFGNRSQLIQVFLNLVKNAAEAVPKNTGEIILRTRYSPGLYITGPGQAGKVSLPLTVSVQDNGPGVPEELGPQLFDPFVTTKTGGSGLGLALVAKIISSHGGVVDIINRPRRTEFRVLLPKSNTAAAVAEDAL